MRKVKATINGYEQDAWVLTKTERETISEIGRLKNNLSNEYEYFFEGKKKETQAETPTEWTIRFNNIIVQLGIVQDIVADTLVNIKAPSLVCKFFYTIEDGGKVRTITVAINYHFDKTVLENMEFAYERFLKVLDDIIDSYADFCGQERLDERADCDLA
jgi:hypothetical protein